MRNHYNNHNSNAILVDDPNDHCWLRHFIFLHLRHADSVFHVVLDAINEFDYHILRYRNDYCYYNGLRNYSSVADHNSGDGIFDSDSAVL